MITERMLVRKVSAYVFDDPLYTADHLAPALRPGFDVLVSLSHIGLTRDRELAARRPEIDLIVGGHTHALLESGEKIGRTTIVQAGWFGKYFGTTKIELDGRELSVTCRVDAL
jgi:2',3'-cyclic-nucleotide 2'-phosphodiesterase (5'-nucleotidase family)